jgi:F-type H+-transporting ATPase subunit delta
MYARALFEAAKDKGELAGAREEVSDLAALVDEVPDLQTALANPELEEAVKAEVLLDILGDASDVTRNFVRLLAEKGRTGEIREIARELDALVAAEERVLQVELTTAIDLGDDDFAAIVRQIEQASGRRVQATRKVDAELIGGIVLQAGSMRLDASVRGRLERLRQELATARS